MKNKPIKFNDLQELKYRLSVKETGIDIVSILNNTTRMMENMYGKKEYHRLRKKYKDAPYVSLSPKEPIDPNRKSFFTWTESNEKETD